ncbi:helix-turn-helix domain-containing protein, partial [Streptomyces sp900116325]|uniref:helix-turn-helix domain-containing protein n=1 Tax=Streptomyces sp. 900116325 TaxID=3154295 RepID=UPI0033C6B589
MTPSVSVPERRGPSGPAAAIEAVSDRRRARHCGESARQLARRLGRSASTVSREFARTSARPARPTWTPSPTSPTTAPQDPLRCHFRPSLCCCERCGCVALVRLRGRPEARRCK